MAYHGQCSKNVDFILLSIWLHCHLPTLDLHMRHCSISFRTYTFWAIVFFRNTSSYGRSVPLIPLGYSCLTSLLCSAWIRHHIKIGFTYKSAAYYIILPHITLWCILLLLFVHFIISMVSRSIHICDQLPVAFRRKGTLLNGPNFVGIQPHISLAESDSS